MERGLTELSFLSRENEDEKESGGKRVSPSHPPRADYYHYCPTRQTATNLGGKPSPLPTVDPNFMGGNGFDDLPDHRSSHGITRCLYSWLNNQQKV